MGKRSTPDIVRPEPWLLTGDEIIEIFESEWGIENEGEEDTEEEAEIREGFGEFIDDNWPLVVGVMVEAQKKLAKWLNDESCEEAWQKVLKHYHISN